MAQAPLPAGSPGTTPTFGADFSCEDDIDPNWSYLQNSPQTPNAESTAYVQAIYRRYTVSRGAMPGDPNYGTNLVNFIGSSTPVAVAVTLIASEARKDQRTTSASCSIAVQNAGTANEEWIVKVVVTANALGTFSLTLAVTSVTVSLLNFGPS